MNFKTNIHPLRACNAWIRSHSAWYRTLLLIFILAGLVYPSANQATAQTPPAPAAIDSSAWSKQNVDAPMLFNYMGDRSLRLDTNNHPHIAFGGDHLYYAYHDGTAWNFEVVDYSDGVGLFAAMALDSLNRPHISYYDAIHGALKYAYFDGANWLITTLDSYAPAGGGKSPAAEADLASIDRYVGDREWRSFPSGLPGDGYAPEAISPISDLIGYGLYSSIAIDVAGNIHISYYDTANGNLKYAHTLFGNWIIQTVDFTNDVGAYSSIAVNSSGYPSHQLL